MLIRAGVDDREILAASGVRIQLIFVFVFAFGAGLAGIAGVVGGTFQSIAPGEDMRFLTVFFSRCYCRWDGLNTWSSSWCCFNWLCRTIWVGLCSNLFSSFNFHHYGRSFGV